jgi:hypothetical protein
MKLYIEVPFDNPECHDQKELIDNTKEEFMALFEPTKPNFLVRIYRLICFFVFLGPIKIITTFVSFGIFYICCCFLPFFRKYFRNNRQFKNWALSVVKPVIRLALLSFGIVKVNVTGELHEDSRTIVSNHLSLIETVAILHQFPVAYLAASYLKSHKFVRKTSEVFEIIFVDREKTANISKQLVNIANDPSLLPVLIFPEGKVTNGDALVGFRTGAYVSDTPVQAVTVRFRQWLCPKSMSTVSWNEDNWFFYCYQVYAIPFITLDLNVLEPLNWKGKDLTPAEKATQSQLQIANALHTKPFAMTNKILFEKKKTE